MFHFAYPVMMKTSLLSSTSATAMLTRTKIPEHPLLQTPQTQPQPPPWPLPPSATTEKMMLLFPPLPTVVETKREK